MKEITEFQTRLAEAGYVAEKDLAATLLLQTKLHRPLLLEGDAGVGKTEIAKTLAKVFDCPLIRLQCYEGLDVNSAVYEWNYQHQLLAIKMQETEAASLESKDHDIFSEKYLLKRPLLQAITMDKSPVLLVDEIDRADEEFEAFLLEVLSDFQISIPELGTIKAITKPHVILTSNGTRELSDALRRRCLYHYVDYPSFDKELRIITTRMPEVSQRLAGQVVEYVQSLRKMDLRKIPGVAETLDWTTALLKLNLSSLDKDPELIMNTLMCLLKTKEDHDLITREISDRLIARSG
ncbi:MAG: MoxR family ATPase [Gammaproteobacteria bacterium]|nr:MoxR family ATPase [Gammaproteobacteria bacterium]